MSTTTTEEVTIKPALSDEAWRQLLAAGLPAAISNQQAALGGAAIALHEHPQGFTWSDVDLLLNRANLADMDATAAEEDGDGLAEVSCRQIAADLRNLAARHAALLAPR